MLPQATHDPGNVLESGFPDGVKILLSNVGLPEAKYRLDHSVIHSHAEALHQLLTHGDHALLGAEFLRIKANVDRILGIEKDAEIEKDEPTSTRS